MTKFKDETGCLPISIAFAIVCVALVYCCNSCESPPAYETRMKREHELKMEKLKLDALRGIKEEQPK